MVDQGLDSDESTPTRENQWTLDVESILDKIRCNSALYSEYHKQEYYKNKGYLKYFKIPTIILSAFSSVFSVGLQPYVEQSAVSVITCLIGLFVGILNSLELFLAIQSTMESELNHSRDFYLLSVDIFKTLLLKRAHRLTKGPVYLDEKYSMYCKLVESSVLTNKVVEDRMLTNNEFITAEVAKQMKKRLWPNVTSVLSSKGAVVEPGSMVGAAGSLMEAAGNVAGSALGVVGSVVGAAGTVAGSVTGSALEAAGNVAGSALGVVGSVVGAAGTVAGTIAGSVTGSALEAAGNVAGPSLKVVGSSFVEENEAPEEKFQFNPNARQFVPYALHVRT